MKISCLHGKNYTNGLFQNKDSLIRFLSVDFNDSHALRLGLKVVHGTARDNAVFHLMKSQLTLVQVISENIWLCISNTMCL